MPVLNMTRPRAVGYLRLPAVGLLAMLAGWSSGDPGYADEPDVENHGLTELRATIQRSVPYIEDRGTWWIEKKKCVSCHRVGTMVWSLTAAQAHGFSVSEELAQWRDWTLDASLKTNQKGKLVGTGNLEGLAQLLQVPQPNRERVDDYATLTRLMVEGQQASGQWTAGGQLPFQKRPQAETNLVSTMWIAWALARVEKSQPTATSAGAGARTAIQQIREAEPGISTEWFVTRLLLAYELGEQAEIKRWRDALLSHQHDDGGWGWLVADSSDALATGMSLFALAGATPTSRPLRQTKGDSAATAKDGNPIQAARQFLVASQREDGTWPVKGTKAKKKDRVEETAVYWGTTWAVLGLLATLPDVER